MTSAYFLADIILQINKKNCMTTSESKGRFFYKTNRFEYRIGMLFFGTLRSVIEYGLPLPFLRLGSCCLNGGGESS